MIRTLSSVRIGTWNLAGRWSAEHRALIDDAHADVWLLTEVSDRVALPGRLVHRGRGMMADRRCWSAIASGAPQTPVADPHPAAAVAEIGGLLWCSLVLPWRSCGSHPWGDGSHAERTTRAVAALDEALPTASPTGLVLGGDLNHALVGREHAGSYGGRGAIESLLSARSLTAPTSDLPHALEGLLTIDHIAVPADWAVVDASRVTAEIGGRRLSDHDAYVVEVAL